MAKQEIKIESCPSCGRKNFRVNGDFIEFEGNDGQKEKYMWKGVLPHEDNQRVYFPVFEDDCRDVWGPQRCSIQQIIDLLRNRKT